MISAIQILQTVKYFAQRADSREKSPRLGILREGVRGRVRFDKQQKMTIKEGQIMRQQGQKVFKRC